MKKIFISIIAFAGASMMTSCVNDLNTLPIDGNVSVADQVYKDFENYEKVLAKVYAGLAVSGQNGDSDISGIDPGFGQFLRGMFNLQELSTDEAICNWNDQTIKDLHNLVWSSSDVYIEAMYNRVFYTVSLCNEYLRQTTDEMLAKRGIAQDKWGIIKGYRAETRWVRAYAYWVGIDLFGSIPFFDEMNPIGTTADVAPKQKSRKDVFDWIVAELKAIEGTDGGLVEAGNAAYYGRATRGAAWALLARLYLNAEVYTGAAQWNEVIKYCDKITAASYSLAPSYANMFLADNDKTSASEFIFVVPYDGRFTQTFGGTTFFISAATGGKMDKAYMGLADWGGLRTTKSFVEKFTNSGDKRNLLFKNGQSLDIPTNNDFAEGYGVQKFRNRTSTGSAGTDGTFSDVDVPLFRLADVYLMYAEAVKRGATTGSEAVAINYLNLIRQRAYGNVSGNISTYDLNYIIDERARELYWESIRRTDLVRFDMLTTEKYIWPWKGGVPDGKAVNSKYNVYPLAASDVAANPNLTQHTGY